MALNDRSLRTLARAIKISQGHFALILVRCNYGALRERMVASLRSLLLAELAESSASKFDLQELALPTSAKTLYTAILAKITSTQPNALMIFGLESVAACDELLKYTNQIRDRFRKNFAFPLVLWVNEELLQKLIRLAPDFKSWAATSIKFEADADELRNFLDSQGLNLFAAILNSGSANPDDWAIAARNVMQASLVLSGLDRESNLKYELSLACKELCDRGIGLEPDLEATTEFVLGRYDQASDLIDSALARYQQSLEFWHSASASFAQWPNAKEYQGVLLLYIGLCHWRKAELYPIDSKTYWLYARENLEECLQVFQQALREDLAAKLLPLLGEALQRLEDWNALQELAEKGIRLHQSQPGLLARDYGFLAEVALVKKQWPGAARIARQALSASAALAAMRQDRGLYLQLLARAQIRLGQKSDAMKNLELALRASSPQQDPKLYLKMLAELRSLYFQKRQYRRAFELKLKARTIEREYNFRAFIGAGQLQPQPRIDKDFSLDSPSNLPSSGLGAVASGLSAPGRQHDIERLLQRMARPDQKVTIIYGESGVGKSSLVNAGLVPALRERAIGDRLALPIVLRSYTNWILALDNRLSEALADLGFTRATVNLEGDPSQSLAGIVEELRYNAERNLLTVLIFDQFEEFFFAIESLEERQIFYRLLQLCLDIPFSKLIFSLRIDFLHYLLEWERSSNLDAINNDILNKNFRYYLGDFNLDDARTVIQDLTEQSEFYLEPELIDALTKDLASDRGTVRPIELQLVGDQLQQQELGLERITTLKQYRQLGSQPKAILIERSIARAIADCGPEHKDKAWQILYLLTDEKNNRPLHTKHKLAETTGFEEELDLILDIFVGSSLAIIHRDRPENKYQLVHDYMVAPIRKKYQSDFGLQARLLQERADKQQYRQKLEKSNHWLKFFSSLTAMLLIVMVTLFSATVKNWQDAEQKRKQAAIDKENIQIAALTASSEALFVDRKEFDALMEALRAWKKLSEAQSPDFPTQLRVLTALQQTVYSVRERNRLEGHGAEVWSVAFSPNGELIASGGNDRLVKIWNRNGSERTTLRGHTNNVTSVSFSPDSQLIATASLDRTVKIWNPNSGQLLTTFSGHRERIYSISFSPNGDLVATASKDRTIKLWRVKDGSPVKRLLGHKKDVNSVSFSPNGKDLLSGSDDLTIKLWSSDGKLLKTLPHGEKVTVVGFKPDGKMMFSAGVNGKIRLWNRDGSFANWWQAHQKAIHSVAFSRDGQTIATASDDNTVKLWSLEGKELMTFRGHSDRVTSVSFAPDGTTIASGGFDKTVRLWALQDTLERPSLNAHGDRVWSVSFSPDGKLVASGSKDNTVKLWNRKGQLLRTLEGHKNLVYSVRFSPDGQLIASASRDKTVKLWRRNGELVKTLEGHRERVYSVAFSPDGKLIASGSGDNTINLWRRDGRLIHTLEGHSDRVYSVAFSPDGKLIASGSRDNTIILWSSNGIPIKTLSGYDGHSSYVTDVKFSPDGSLLASAGWDNTVKIWQSDGTLVRTLLQGYSDSVESISFSPDGKTLASAGWDNMVKLWNIEDGSFIKGLQGHTSGIMDVSFSPDGKTIASASDDNTIVLWNLDREDLIVRACDWVRDYLQHNPNARSRDRDLCDDYEF
ncbi:MAG: hypothetical protein F6J93_05880 [Oscillatoria sp. SIO1A7]|nr:hypothetical protein [Oscillatoria sp. SIO1A7]